jgi:sulfur relay (sulfurtransferase) DsrF/TusC family protein
MAILSIVETAYRAVLEEQDDTILWLNHNLKNAGADIALLLKGNAVNYAVRGQEASGLRFGEVELTHPPALDQDLGNLITAGVPVYIVEDDLRERGLSNEYLIPGLTKTTRSEIPALLDRFEQVWHW